MLLFFSFILAILIGATIHLLSLKVEILKELGFYIFTVFYLIGGAGLIVSTVDIPIELIHQKTYNLKWEQQYEDLNKRINNWKAGDISDAALWSNVSQYNQELIEAQHYGKSIWFNWYTDRACLNYEIIDISEYNREIEQ